MVRMRKQCVPGVSPPPSQTPGYEARRVGVMGAGGRGGRNGREQEEEGREMEDEKHRQKQVEVL